MSDWRDSAACQGMDPDLWFPVSAEPRSRLEAEHLKLALDTCRSCPVRLECLEFAVRTGQRGTWGGMTERQRSYSRACRKLRRESVAV